MSSKAPSQLIKCPVCNLDVKRRGLHSHLRLAHPGVDAKQKLRNVIISPQVKGDRILLQLSLTEFNEYRIKYTSIKFCDIEMLGNFFAAKFKVAGFDFSNLKAGPEITTVEEGLAHGGRWDGSYCGPDE
jgi:hypothetical protein